MGQYLYPSASFSLFFNSYQEKISFINELPTIMHEEVHLYIDINKINNKELDIELHGEEEKNIQTTKEKIINLYNKIENNETNKWKFW